MASNQDFSERDRVLILGGTGFVGKRLVRELAGKGIKVRVLVRSLSKSGGLCCGDEDVEIVKGDVLTREGLGEALAGIHSAYYLIHSMGGTSIFRNIEYAEKDKLAARNFMKEAENSGLKRVLYLGALGEAGKDLSHHLQSRAEVASILASSDSIAATILRAAIIIGAGGASFEMLRYLVERLPVMGCPKWIDTRIQPIAVQDVLGYLVGCLLNSKTEGQTFDIGGPDVLSYRDMMHEYALARGLSRRLIFRVPFLTPLLSAYWVDLVTPIPSGVAHPLIDGMKSEVICRDTRIQDYVTLRLTPFREAVRMAHSEETAGPGVFGG